MENEENSVEASLKFFAKSSIIVFVFIILSKLLSYVFRVIIARYFHSEVYGLFSLGTAITECLVAIFLLGLATGVVRFISLYRGEDNIEKIRYVIKVSKITVIISGLIGGLILLIFSNIIAVNIFNEPRLRIYLIFFSLAVPISVIGTFFMSLLQAYEQINWYSFIKSVLFNLVELIALISLIFIFMSLNFDKGIFYYSIIISYIFTHISILIVSYSLCKIKLNSSIKKSNLGKEEGKIITKELFSFSWPLIFVGLVTILFSWIDSFMIGIYKDASAVGIYNVAVPIALLLTIASQLFVYLFLPIITKEYARGNKYLIKELTQQIGKWIFMINLPILMIVFIFPGTIINILFGPEYLSAMWSLRFLSIAMIFNSILFFSQYLLSMIGKTKEILYYLIISTIINIILNMILIPMPIIAGLDNSLGLVGASIATMITYIVWSIITILTAKKHLGIVPIRKKMLMIGIVSIIPTLLIYFIRNLFPKTLIFLILEGLIFLIVYTILIIITKCLDKNDLMIINAIKNKLKIKG